MPRHSLFPNSITIHYSSNGHSHVQVLPIDAITGSAPNWLVSPRVGSDVLWTTAVDDYADLLKPMFESTSSIDYAELFTYEAPEGPPEFLASHTLGVAGTSIGNEVPWCQAMFPFKGVGGTQLRWTILESTIGSDQHIGYGEIGAGVFKDMVDWILSDDGWIITRGGGFPTVSLGLTSKINDKLRKAFLLDV